MKKICLTIILSVLVYIGLLIGLPNHASFIGFKIIFGFVSILVGAIFAIYISELLEKREQSIDEFDETRELQSMIDYKRRQRRKILIPLSFVLVISLCMVIVVNLRNQDSNSFNLKRGKYTIEQYEDMVYDDDLLEMDHLPPIRVLGEVSERRVKTIARKYLYTQPMDLLDDVGLIFLCDEEMFEDARVTYRMDDENVIAFAVPDSNFIYIDVSQRDKLATVTHELGHIYDFSHNYPSADYDFEDLYYEVDENELYQFSNEMNVYYSLSDIGEFFAELTHMYFNHNDELRHMSDIYSYFEDLYGPYDDVIFAKDYLDE